MEGNRTKELNYYIKRAAGVNMFGKETEQIIETAINSKKENAIENYGPTYNSDHEGYAVLKEEIEEADSALKYIQDELCDLWKVIKINDYPKYKQEIIKRIVKEAKNLAMEACQIAAVGKKFLEIFGE